MSSLTLDSGMTFSMLKDDLEEFILKDISPSEVPLIDALKLRAALRNILDGDKVYNDGDLKVDSNEVKDDSYEVILAKKEISTLTAQLYNEYKKVKQLTEEVKYLEGKLSRVEQELESISNRLLNR